MRQERGHFRRAHLPGMPPAPARLPLKDQGPPNPMPIDLLRPARIMEKAHHLPHLLLEFELGIGDKQPPLRRPAAGTMDRCWTGGAPLAEFLRTKISILRQSRRFYDCWPLKGA